jgi:hypothetical protein
LEVSNRISSNAPFGIDTYPSIYLIFAGRKILEHCVDSRSILINFFLPSMYLYGTLAYYPSNMFFGKGAMLIYCLNLAAIYYSSASSILAFVFEIIDN